MTADTEALRPCPFCGQPPAFLGTDSYGYEVVRCKPCNFELANGRMLGGVAAVWNRRAPADPWQALGRAVDAVLSDMEHEDDCFVLKNTGVQGEGPFDCDCLVSRLRAARAATVPK